LNDRHGRAILIMNRYFQDRSLKDLPGVEQDEYNLRTVFQRLLFDVDTWPNLDKQVLSKFLHDFRSLSVKTYKFKLRL